MIWRVVFVTHKVPDVSSCSVQWLFTVRSKRNPSIYRQLPFDVWNFLNLTKCNLSHIQEVTADPMLRSCPCCFLLRAHRSFRSCLQALLSWDSLCMRARQGPPSCFCVWISSFLRTVPWEAVPFSMEWS